MTGTTSGSLYPSLAKLEQAGWIVGERESIDPREEGRPARRYYMLTAEVLRPVLGRWLNLVSSFVRRRSRGCLSRFAMPLAVLVRRVASHERG